MAIDSTMLVALRSIASQQSDPTEKTLEASMMLLDYATTNLHASILYTVSNMVL